MRSSYASAPLRWLVLLALGLGLTYVPLTLTAVARLPHGDSGVGSASLNTAQQIGGAIGLAALTTVFTHASGVRQDELTAPTLAAGPKGAMTREQAVLALGQVQRDAQTVGSTTTFLVATLVILAAALVVMMLLRERREEPAG